MGQRRRLPVWLPMTGKPAGLWFLRSMGDRDTHRGVLRSDGTVDAACGVDFRPRPLPYGKVALPGNPQDPEQICPQCANGLPANRGAR